MVNRNKLRLLYLYQYLVQNTDAEHPMSTMELIRMLKNEYDLTATRNTISDDLSILHDCGLHIEHYESTQNKYYYDGQVYSTTELKILADAVASSKFITQRKSEALIAKLLALTNTQNANMLRRHISVSGRVKSDNESGYLIVDKINQAIDLKRKISFKYVDYTADRIRFTTNDGKAYTVSPYTLIWDGDYYYLRGYCDERNAMRNFRLDRIESEPEILDEFAVIAPDDYNLDTYEKTVFRMFDTDEPSEVEIECDNSVMKYLIDNFGEDFTSEKIDDKMFRAKIYVCPSVTFFRWVFGFNRAIRIVGPDCVLKQYREMLLNAAND